MIRINDGGEGRNQALRTALSLSMLTGRGVRVSGGVGDGLQPKSGLGQGGLACVEAAAEICGAEYEAELKSDQVEFNPGPIQAGTYNFDLAQIGPTSAPLSQVALTVALPLCRAGGDSVCVIGGGTHVIGGLTSDELVHMLGPCYRKLGLQAGFTEIAPGFHPDGGGEAEVRVRSCAELKPLEAESPFVPQKMGIEVIVSNLPIYLAEQALEGAQDRLANRGRQATGKVRRARGAAGMALMVWAEMDGLRVAYTSIGRRGGRPEALALEAVDRLETFLDSGTGINPMLGAELLLPLACAAGTSHFTMPAISRGFRGAFRVIEAFWPGTIRVFQHKNGLMAVKVTGRDFGRR